MIRANLCIDKRTKKKNGNYPIKINIYSNGRNLLLTTGMDVGLDNWTGEAYGKNEPNYRAKNMRLREMMNKVERVLFDAEEKSMAVSTATLKKMIEDRLSGKTDNITFTRCAEQFVTLKTKDRTIKLYEQTINRIREYAGGDVAFTEINKEWLAKFEKYMLGRGNNVNTIAVHMRNIRAIFNHAIDQEYTQIYPFRKYKIKKMETAKRSLSVEELRKLITCDVEEYQEKYRDIFMLMFYLMGINAIDLFQLPPLQGNKITYNRAKTNKLYEIKVEPEAMDIIERYKGEKYMINVLDTYTDYKDFNRRMNEGLKKIGDLQRVGLGGKKIITPYFPKLSTYWARHTWATIAAELDIPKETIAAALGHSSNSVTDMYIRFDKRKIERANRMVIDYVLGIK